MEYMTCYLYPGVLFYGTNIIITLIFVFFTLFNTPTLDVPNIGPPTTYSFHPNTC